MTLQAALYRGGGWRIPEQPGRPVAGWESSHERARESSPLLGGLPAREGGLRSGRPRSAQGWRRRARHGIAFVLRHKLSAAARAPAVLGKGSFLLGWCAARRTGGAESAPAPAQPSPARAAALSPCATHILLQLARERGGSEAGPGLARWREGALGVGSGAEACAPRGAACRCLCAEPSRGARARGGGGRFWVSAAAAAAAAAARAVAGHLGGRLRVSSGGRAGC